MLVATSNPETAKLDQYECGMPPASDARHKFQISFFLVAILFLLFDLEILFLYPLAVSLYHISLYGFWIALFFILIITIGFVYELASNTLDYAKTHSSQNTPSNGKLPTGIRFYSTFSYNSSGLTADGRRKRDKGNPIYSCQYKPTQTIQNPNAISSRTRDFASR
jgi:NADH:ubiquinone oxidoreductase subunit 3 (subunit A)